MFSLIITIIAIALVAALLVATLYFGGRALNKGSDEAVAATAVNQGNQVVGALELYRADHGALPTGTAQDIQDALVDGNYLKAWPDTVWVPRNDYVVRTGVSHDACVALNAKLGISGVPQCSDAAFEGRTVCCEAAP